MLQALVSRVADELRPMPDRLAGTLRITAAALIVIVIMLTFRNKALSLGPFLIFMLMQRSTLMTRLAGILLIVGILLASFLVIVVAMTAWDIAWLRILLMASFFWLGFFVLNRNPAFFILAIPYLAVLSLTIFYFDSYSIPNQLISELGWLWAAFGLAFLSTMLVQYLFAAPTAIQLLRDDVHRILSLAEGLCLDRAFGHGRRERSRRIAGSMARKEEGTTELLEKIAKLKIVSAPQEENILRVLHAAGETSKAALSPGGPAERSLWLNWASRLRALRGRVFRSVPIRATAAEPAPEFPEAGESLLDAEAAVSSSPRELKPPPEPKARPLEFSHAEFANRATAAMMACYFFASITNWSGIHTCMITCAITALSHYDAQTSKQRQRILGASLGGLMSLVAMIWLVPAFNTITGIFCILAVGTALSAWVASGREAVSYVGVQMVFAFYMTLLQDPHATTELTVLRDRLIGIFLGIAAMRVAFTLFTEKRAIPEAQLSIA